MSNKPFYSVIIPTLNEEDYLPELLQDLVNQSHHSFEVIVVDGHSRDQTIAIARKFAKEKIFPMRVLTSSKRHVCTQRNLGAKVATSPWLIFMDADTRLPPDFLELLQEKLKNAHATLATTWASSDPDAPLEKVIILALNLAVELASNTSRSTFPEAMTIIEHSLFDQIGGFNENIHFAESQDLTQKARNCGARFRVFRSPRYRYSLRRLHKYGALELASRMAKAQLNTYLGTKLTDQEIKELYPMRGGSFFAKPIPKQKNFISNIWQIITKNSQKTSSKHKAEELV